MSLNESTILLTGHSGFKGSWLCAVLAGKGAKVNGLALPGDEEGALIRSLRDARLLEREFFADIRELKACEEAVAKAKPEVVFHLAAQALVRRSYRDPLETWTTNVIGTANILEACRNCRSVKVIVVVTTDKCYENKDRVHLYREEDRLGGHDPYSASKACAELVVSSYRDSYFREAGIQVATARAGNVIGGGDFAEDRLLPDAVRAFAKNKPLVLRNPSATRPWQHVLDPLSGYITLAERLLSAPDLGFDTAWNFGPDVDGSASVGEVAEKIGRLWGDGKVEYPRKASGPYEAGHLQLDNSRAKSQLGWKPRWGLDHALHNTALWYRTWYEGGDTAALMKRQITEYFSCESRG
jgi:CDP-glucose 4,6-dehydratase